ncbi:hypothetical protein ACFY7C_06410 [Streptomyces sp. NPDC012769]|uniref:hypothetical protein n=1 Tax=Streptomyces sp. NPDC012769 TaxID=3364848 RepID=UPI00368B0396
MPPPRPRPRPAPSPVEKIRARALRSQGWGIGLLTVAALLWVWSAVLLLTPYETDAGNGCGTLLTDEYHHDEACYESRDWPEILGLLAASLPFAVAGSITYTRGTLTHRLAPLLVDLDEGSEE